MTPVRFDVFPRTSYWMLIDSIHPVTYHVTCEAALRAAFQQIEQHQLSASVFVHDRDGSAQEAFSSATTKQPHTDSEG